MKSSKASVVIVTYNNEDDISACLESVLAQDYPNYEIIVVDNASSDHTASIVRRYQNIKLFIQKSNIGYAAANNLGAKKSSGEYLVFLNPDTRVTSNWLSNLLIPLSNGFEGLVTSKVINSNNNLLNACGLQVHFCGFGYCNHQNHLPKGINGTFLVTAVSGCSFSTTRRIWNELGGFDERFFLYLEDVDLSLRARDLGYSCLCIASSVLYHNYNPELSPLKYYYIERNRMWLIKKLYNKKFRRLLILSLILAETMAWGYAISKGFPYIKSKIEALKDRKTPVVTCENVFAISKVLTHKTPRHLMPGYLSPFNFFADFFFWLNTILISSVVRVKK